MSQTHTTRLTVIALCGLVAIAGCGKRSSPKSEDSAEIECMARAMYFESNRSSRDGMIAVGSVVMNRVQSDAYPNTICGVVGQKNQFAPGVMSKPMNAGSTLAFASARSVYQGERHPNIGTAKFFHAAWYKANFDNMHYVVTTGGNAFYEKRKSHRVTASSPVRATEGVTGG